MVLFPKQRLSRTNEIQYVAVSPATAKALPKPIRLRDDPSRKLPPKVTMQPVAPPPFEGDPAVASSGERAGRLRRVLPFSEAEFSKPAFSRTDIISVKKKITLPPVDIEKIKNPEYIQYYQLVREKIRRAAYHNYSLTDQGSIFMSFVISHNGSIQDVRFIPERSTGNEYLKGVALKSIYDAAPFPDFPRRLDYQQLSFNVVISFETE